MSSPSNKESKIEWLRIGPYKSLLTHTRYLLTLRSKEDRYHSLILFRLSTLSTSLDVLAVDSDSTLPATATTATPNEDGDHDHNRLQLYAMESNCPHLGADMSHAEIEEYEESYVAVCPWHRYDFDLKTGKSETGLRACTFAIDVRTEVDPAEQHDAVPVDTVYVETPGGGSSWRLLQLRPVSEEFADPPPALVATLPLPKVPRAASRVDESIVPETGPPPTTLMHWAVLILNTANPVLKVQRTRHAAHLFRTGKLASIGHRSANAPAPPHVPPREERVLSNTVDPAKVRNRKNRAVMLHALANIEQWAWDIMARFGPKHPELPHAFFSDFIKMAEDEAKHFSLLTSRLHDIAPTTPYGTLPVHAALWESAQATAHSLLARLAIIHLVHEARGLDVNPGTIARFRKAGDGDTVRVMETIHADEVTHVTTGHRWFVWLCERGGGGGGGAAAAAGDGDGDGGIMLDGVGGGQTQKLDPVKVFREEVRKGWRGDIKGPFNVEDREKAGLAREFYEDLRGEMGMVGVDAKDFNLKGNEGGPGVELAYEVATQ